MKTPHLIPHTMVEVNKGKLIFAPALPPKGECRGQILNIHPDLETPYLIPHMIVEVKIRSSFLLFLLFCP